MKHDIQHQAAVYSIPEFCKAHGISRGTFYNLEKRGEAPQTMRLGSRVLITLEAAAAWRKAMEERSSSAAA